MKSCACAGVAKIIVRASQIQPRVVRFFHDALNLITFQKQFTAHPPLCQAPELNFFIEYFPQKSASGGQESVGRGRAADVPRIQRRMKELFPELENDYGS